MKGGKTMKKIKLGKKSVVIAVMVLLLSGAVYVNWLVSGGGMTLTDLVNGNSSERTLGNAELVNANADADGKTQNTSSTDAADTSASGEVFTDLRITRTRTHDENISVLKTVAEDETLTSDEKKSAVDTLAQLVANMQAETNIENLVKAKGFIDCIVFVNDSNVTVTVAAVDTLTANQAAQIKDIAVGETNYAADCIKIVEVG